jgi:hypothetical protein
MTANPKVSDLCTLRIAEPVTGQVERCAGAADRRSTGIERIGEVVIM